MRSATPETERSSTPDLRRFQRQIEGRPAGEYDFLLLLGLRPATWPELLRATSEGLPYSVFEHLRANTGMSETALYDWIQIASRTADRRQQQGRFLPDESDRIIRAGRLFARALELHEGDRDRTMKWLLSPQRALRGLVPVHVARTDIGTRAVEDLIGRLEHGVIS